MLHNKEKKCSETASGRMQDVDEPWPLEVFDHDGRAHQASLQPGEMLLYEGATCAHGRTAPLNGRFMANVFVHFMERAEADA